MVQVNKKDSVEENLVQVNKKEPSEIITVVKNDSDEETVDEFFNDITKIMENKGEMVNKNPKQYTLFDDAIPEE